MTSDGKVVTGQRVFVRKHEDNRQMTWTQNDEAKPKHALEIFTVFSAIHSYEASLVSERLPSWFVTLLKRFLRARAGRL